MLPRLLVALAIVILPNAAAQPAPEATLSLDMAPGPTDVSLGSTHEVPFTVTFTLSGVVCTSAAQARIPIAIMDKPSPLAGVKATPKPAEMVFDIPAGSYASTPYTKDAMGDLAVSVASDASADHEHAFVLTASYAGGLPAGCQGTGSLAATDASGEHTIMTGAAATGGTDPTHQMSDGSSMQGDAMSSEKPTPGFGPALVAAGILAAAALARRR